MHDTEAFLVDSPLQGATVEVVHRGVSTYEADRSALLLQRERCDRLATVGTMCAGILHEVNNPLAYVLSNIDLVLHSIRQLPPDEQGDGGRPWLAEAVSALSDAYAGATRIAVIVADLNTYTRPQREPTEALTLGDVIDQSLRVAGSQLRGRGRVVRRYGAAPCVEAPAGRLSQVLVNLLVNAAQALDPAHLDTNEVVVTTSTDASGWAVVEIRDNGCGMTPAVMARAREPFFTTKAPGQGTGLGLSVCQGITESLGGTLTFESAPGSGTVIRVRLPAAPRQPH